MKTYEVFENGYKIGLAILSENPARHELEKACILNDGGYLVPGRIEDWGVRDDGSIAIRYVFEDQSPAADLLLTKMYASDEEIEGYEVFENGVRIGFAMLLKNPTGRELEEARVFEPTTCLIPGEIEDWEYGDGSITIRHSFEGQSPTTKLVPVSVKMYTEEEVQREIEKYAVRHGVPLDAVNVSVCRRDVDSTIVGFRLSHDGYEYYGMWQYL